MEGMHALEYENFMRNYAGGRPIPLSKFDKFISAIKDGNLELAQTLFNENKFDPNNSSATLSASGESAIHIATREGHVECVNFLLEQGADVNLVEKRKKTAMHFAAGAGHLKIVKLLIQKEASLNMNDKFGRTPLMWATSAGHINVVRVLLDAGASVESGQGNWHPLHEACKQGFLEIAKVLIKAGSLVNNPYKYTGCTPWSPLHIAARGGHLDCVNMLIDFGADIHCKNAGGHTSLHEAAYRGYSDIVLRLLQYNGNPNSTNNQKRTPLHEACSQGKLACAILLLDAGSKPNAQDMIFDTPLHLALRARHPPPTTISLITILLQYGASPSLLGSNDETPVDILQDTGQSEFLDLLKDALENPNTLMQMCKVAIRRKLKFMTNPEKVNSLPLPSSVKNFLQEDGVEREEIN